MTSREIPGFYFDEQKKKYFRIVNGDQRFNSAYQNNSIQSSNREKERLSRSSNKRPKYGVDPGEVSRNAQLTSRSLNLSQRICQLKLGLDSICGILQSRLEYAMANSNLKPLIDNAVWTGLNKEQAFVAIRLTIKLYYVSDVLSGIDSAHMCLGIHHMSTDPLDANIIVDLCHNGKFVFCQNQKTYSLQKWSCYRGRYRIEILTTTLMEAIAEEFIKEGQLNPPPIRFVAQFSANRLHLICGEGYLFVFDLDSLSIRASRKIPFRRFENLHLYSSIHPCDGYIVFNLHKAIFVYDEKKDFFSKWHVPKHVIHRLFVEAITMKKADSKTEWIFKLRAVTAHAIILVEFSSATSKFSSLNSDILLYNTNQTKPLIDKCENLLVIEESTSKLRIFNLKSNSMRAIAVTEPLPKNREQRPRLVEMQNTLLISLTNQTLIFQE